MSEERVTWMKLAVAADDSVSAKSLSEGPYPEKLVFEYNGIDYSIVPHKSLNEDERKMKILVAPETLKKQILSTDEFTNFFTTFCDCLKGRTTDKDMREMLNTFTKILNNQEQLRRFILEHPSVDEVVEKFETFQLNKYLNDWKIGMFQSFKLVDGRVEIHINSLVNTIVIFKNKVKARFMEVKENNLTEAMKEYDASLAEIEPFASILELKKSFTKQKEYIQDRARGEWLAIPENEREGDYISWAKSWWEIESINEIFRVLDNAIKSGDLQEFFKNNPELLKPKASTVDHL